MLKKILIGGAGALVLLLGALAVAGNTPREIRTEIDIAAPPQAVWDVLVKVDAWPSWNTTVAKASGTAALGSELDLTMFAEDGKSDGPQYQPTVTTFEPPTVLEWRAKMGAGFIFTNDKALELVPTAKGTKLIHIERFSGMMVPVMGAKMDEGVPPILKAMNDALKVFLERS